MLAKQVKNRLFTILLFTTMKVKTKTVCRWCECPVTDTKMANVEWSDNDPDDLIILHKLCSTEWSVYHGKPDRWRTLKDYLKTGREQVYY